MPRLSLKTVVLRAIGSALLDRESLADSYSARDPYRAKVLAQIEKVNQLRVTLESQRKPMPDLPEETRQLAGAVLVWATQWEESLVDANHNQGAYAKRCAALAHLYKSTRLAHFGPTQMERDLKGMRMVDLHEIKGSAAD